MTRLVARTAAAVAMLVAAAALISTCTQAAVTTTRFSTVGAPDRTAPTGTVSGVRSPVEAGSTLNLTIDAYDAGSGLESAEAAIDGNTATVALCTIAPGGECPKSASNVPLAIDVGGEGSHELVVTVSDAAGDTATLVEEAIEVRGMRPPSGASVVIAVGIAGGGHGPPEGPPPKERPGHGGRPERGVLSSKEGAAPACRAPMLSMRLASRPLGYAAHHVPVLRRGGRYLFAGRLTCRRGARRVSAPDGTPVRVRRLIGGCGLRLWRCTLIPPASVIRTRHGRLRARVRIAGPGAVIFEYRPPGGESVRVRLRVAVAPQGECPRRGGHDRWEHRRCRRRHRRRHRRLRRSRGRR